VSFSCGSADKEEFYEANKVLGVQDTELHEYPTRQFKEHRQEILEHLVRLERQVSPDLVLIPATTDTHQDHEVIRDEGFRAFKRHSLLGYEMPQNNLVFQTHCFVELQPVDIAKKVEALGCYLSQRNRPYASEEFIKGLALVRGMQAGKKYAEAYEVMRWMI
jgi:LmbE family N-acetylglucosaminyl deacetylase